MSANLNHEHRSDLIKTVVTGAYGGKTVSANLNLDKTTTDKYVAEAGLTYPGRSLAFETDVTKMMDGEHKVTMSTQWAQGSDSKMSATASYKPGSVHEISTDIKFPGYPVTLSASVK